jgi:two-component system cell cycle response regulator DivK
MGHKILVADDDYDNRAILCDAFEAADFSVVQAVDGLEAVALAVQEAPALIIMDLAMPRMDGWEATRHLRRLPETARVLIVAFSAHAFEGEEIRAKNAGCDGYLAKPCIPRDVVKTVRELLMARGASC